MNQEYRDWEHLLQPATKTFVSSWTVTSRLWFIDTHIKEQVKICVVAL